MRTKTIAVLLSLAMLLSLLSACGAEKEPESAPPEVLLPAEDIARAVSSAALDEPEDGPESLGEQLEAYTEAAYGLPAEKWEDCAVLRATGVRAYEIAVMRFAGEAETAYGEEQLGAYRNARESAFTGYAPDEAALVSGAKICRMGNYVGLFICEDPEAAEELFTSILESGEVPEVVVKPEPEPEPKPEPVFGLGENQITWSKLLDPIEEACRSEMDALEAAGNPVGFYMTGYYEGFEEMAETVYGLSSDQLMEGCIFKPDQTDEYAFELAVFRMVDEDAAEAGMEALLGYLITRMTDFGDKDDTQLELLQGASIDHEQEYIAFFACANADEVSSIFHKTVKALFPANPDEAAGYRNPEDPPLVEIAEGVFVTEARWPEPEGEADPDHPGRLKYLTMDNENMRLYDTSAIVGAWESGDPSGLSEEDKAIYDNAKEVLDGILWDDMGDFEKEVEIYNWVLRNISYDATHMDILAEDARDSYTPYGGLVDREAVCMGYATTFQLLTELAGLESIAVAGTARSEEVHGWAMVRLNGEWYCVDPTWDWSFYEYGMMEGREWRYFNVTSDYMARTNHQWNYDAVPEATAEDYGAPSRALT